MTQTPNRRDILKAGSAAAGFALTQLALTDFAFPGQADDEELVPFLNMPRTGPNRLDWETLDKWITPQDQVFSVQHYGTPTVDMKKYKLEVSGLFEKPRSLTLDQIKALPKVDQLMTLECSGNGASKGFMNAIYNSKWTGTPLSDFLKASGLKNTAKEVVFYGADHKEEKIRNVTVDVPFGRSMSIEEVMHPQAILAYARNGKPLEVRNGAPLRVIVPGYYGIANVKWLMRIEARNRRYMGRYMARDYVTLRGERKNGQIVYVESSVSKMNLKSIVARVTRGVTKNGQVPCKAYGAVWGDGTPIKRVEVQVDGGEWREAKLDKEPRSKYCWLFFSIDLGELKPGKHTLVSRGIDANGRVQPSAKDDEIALKKTYWEAYQQWPREIELEA